MGRRLKEEIGGGKAPIECIKTDCVMYRERIGQAPERRCAALEKDDGDEDPFNGRECPFYKTKADIVADYEGIKNGTLRPISKARAQILGELETQLKGIIKTKEDL